MAEPKGSPPASMLDRFIRFGTNAAGIERMLRMVQAIVMIVLAHTSLTSGFAKLVSQVGNKHLWAGDAPRSGSVEVLIELRKRVALARRFFRVFRFLESFQAAYVIYTSFYAATVPAVGGAVEGEKGSSALTGAEKAGDIGHNHEQINGHDSAKTSEATQAETTATTQPAQPKRTCNCKHHHNHSHKPQDPTKIPIEAWLDIFARTFNGMYLFLETLMLVDALELPGFSLWGAQWGPILHVEGQRFWLFALVCGIGSAVIKLAKLVRYAPVVRVPQIGEGWGWGWGERKAESELADWEQMRDKMRRLVWHRRETKKAWRRELRTKGWRTARRCVADVLDLTVPGVVVGWVNVKPGTVGFAMLWSTWITGIEIWERL